MKVSLATIILPAAFASCQAVLPQTPLITTKGFANLTVRYRQVSPQDFGLQSNLKSYSGNVNVDADQHIFWRFVEAGHNPDQRPLTVVFGSGLGVESVRLNDSNFVSRIN